jgi:agmatine/peptidylarginine deiminase
MTAALASRYPEVFWPIKINLEVSGVEVKVIHKTENIWCRDWMPIQINGELFRFQYKTVEYSKWPQLDVSNEPWTGAFSSPIRTFPNIIIDGGNVVAGFGKVIMTDKVIKENGSSIVGQLEKLFNSQIIIVPTECGDDLGHSDGIVKFINADTVLINDYSRIAKRDKSFYAYENELENILRSHGFAIHKIINTYDLWDWNMPERQFRQFFPFADAYGPGYGYHINFLRVGSVILLPAMKIKQDAEAFETIRTHYSDCRIVMIDCSRISFEGGLVHCSTAGPYTS